MRAAAPSGDLWFQLFSTADPAVDGDLLSRAEAAGYSTVLLTVDTTVSGMRLRDVVNGRTIAPTLTARTVRWFDELTNGGMVSEGDAAHTHTPVSASRVDEPVVPT